MRRHDHGALDNESQARSNRERRFGIFDRSQKFHRVAKMPVRH